MNKCNQRKTKFISFHAFTKKYMYLYMFSKSHITKELEILQEQKKSYRKIRLKSYIRFKGRQIEVLYQI